MLLGTALPIGQVPEASHPPAEAVVMALADLRTIPAASQCQTRYLWLGNVPARDRNSLAVILSGHVNSLSREAEIVRPLIVGGLLLRLDLGDYGWSSDVWEKLADPLFTVELEQQVVVEQKWYPAGRYTDGSTYPAGYYPVKQKKRVKAGAPWLDAKVTGELYVLSQSRTPVVGALWFLNTTAIQANRDAGYYDFLGIRNQKDYFALVGFDSKLARSRELREAVSDSGVTQQPRRIERWPVVGGGLWRTFDSARATDRANPLRVLDDEFRFQASEEIGHGPNGLLIYGLFDNQGTRQDSAPDNIARDHTSPNNDARVHVGLSCVRCHGPASGFNAIDGWARGLFQGAVKLQSPDPEKLRTLRRQYLRSLEPHMDRDRGIYAEALAEATGLKPADYAAEYGNWFSRYEDARVDVAWVARDLGLDPARFQDALKRYAIAGGSVDTSVGTFLRINPKGLPIRQYEESLVVLWQAYKGGGGP